MSAPQDGTDTCQQLSGAERLGDVVVSAEFQAQHAVHLLAPSTDDDDRYVTCAAKLPAQVEAGDAGQADIN